MLEGLGRHKSPPDERDYPMRAALAPELAEAALDGLPTYKYHRVHYPRLDQDVTSQCTIYSSVGCYLTGPNVIRPTHTFQEMYDWAQKNDYWPGAEPDYYGTSTRASGKAAVHFGYATAYRFCYSIEELVKALQLGPAVIGMDWYEGMSRPDPRHFIRIEGEDEGGHQIEISGYNRADKKFRLPQSWGMGWGDDGMCWASFDTIGRSVEAGAEIMVLTERQPA